MNPFQLHKVEERLTKQEVFRKLAHNNDFLWYLKELKEIRDEVKMELFDNRKKVSEIPRDRLIELMTFWKAFDRMIEVPLNIREQQKSQKRSKYGK